MFRPLPVLTAATVLALAVLIGLGTWQLQRRDQKHALIESIENRASLPSAPVEILFTAGDAFAAYRPATATGTFDHANEAYVYTPRADTGPTRQGVRVLTPFKLLSGPVILVDRGWVANEAKDPKTREKGQIGGEVELEGRLLPATSPATFTPPPELKTKTFYVRDIEAIGKALGVRFDRRLIFEATTRNEGGPEPLPTVLILPDNHLSYAITWFSLGVVLVVIYFRLHYMRGRLRFSR